MPRNISGDDAPSVNVLIKLTEYGNEIHVYENCYAEPHGAEILIYSYEDGPRPYPRAALSRAHAIRVEHTGNHGNRFRSQTPVPQQADKMPPRPPQQPPAPPVRPALPPSDYTSQSLSPVPQPLPQRVSARRQVPEVEETSEGEINLGEWPNNFPKDPSTSDFFSRDVETPPGDSPEESSSDQNEESTSGLKSLVQIVKGNGDNGRTELSDDDEPSPEDPPAGGWSPSGNKFKRTEPKSRHGAARRMGRTGRAVLGLAVLASAMLGSSYGPHPLS